MTCNSTLLVEGGASLSSWLKVSGTALFGTLTALTGAFGTGEVQIDKTSNGTLLLHRTSADNGGPTIEFLKRRSGWNVVSDGDRMGSIGWSAADGSAAANSVQLYAEVDGTPGSGDMPGRLIIAVSPDGSSTVSEAIRISNDKSFKFSGTPQFGAGNTTGSGSAALGSNCPASTLTAPYKWITCKSSDGSTVYIPCWK